MLNKYWILAIYLFEHFNNVFRLNTLHPKCCWINGIFLE